MTLCTEILKQPPVSFECQDIIQESLISWLYNNGCDSYVYDISIMREWIFYLVNHLESVHIITLLISQFSKVIPSSMYSFYGIALFTKNCSYDPIVLDIISTAIQTISDPLFCSLLNDMVQHRSAKKAFHSHFPFE